MEPRYKVVVDVGDGSVVVEHATGVRVVRELPDGSFRFEFSTPEPSRGSETDSVDGQERTG
jgi:hypothetical protein